MRTGFRAVTAIAVAILASGCATFDVSSYKASPLSGTPKGSLLIGIPPATGAGHGGAASEINAAWEAALKADAAGFGGALKACGFDSSGKAGPAMAAPLVPLVAAFAQLGFEALLDKRKQRLEAIVEAARSEYSVTLPVDGLKDVPCFALVRSTKDDKLVKPQMLAVLQLVEQQSATTDTKVVMVKPVYVRLATAVAETKATDKPAISVSFGVSVKAVVREQNAQVSRLVPAGETAVTVADVPLSATPVPVCSEGECRPSDFLPFPTNRGTLSLTVSVVEQGKTGFDDKAASAELAALKAALGPAIGETVKIKYTPE